MDKKTVGILSYCTLIGYIIAWVFHSQEKTKFGAFHLRQATGVVALAVAYWILMMILIRIPLLWSVLGIVSPIFWIGILVLVIIGIINANNEEEKELPIIGKLANDTFKFID